MLRKMIKSDLSKLLAIEETVHITPWSEETFIICFQAGYEGWLIEIDKKIIGFIIISINKDECHILNIAVLPAHQRKGYGEKLINHVTDRAREQGIGIAYLEVRRSNSRAINLYQKLKFHFITERKDYYPTISGHEDALIFAKNLLKNRYL